MLMMPADSLIATIKTLIEGPWTARELAVELGRPLRTAQAWLKCLKELGAPVECDGAQVPSYRLRRGETITWLVGQ